MYRIPILFLLALLIPVRGYAQSRTSLNGGGGSGTKASYTIQFTVGEPIPGDLIASGGYKLALGFLEIPLEVDVTPPDITPQGLPIQASVAQDIDIETEVTDPGSGVESVTLYYRKGGDPSFTQQPMSLSSGDTYAGTIPSASVTTRGVEYYITASDTSKNASQVPALQDAEPYFPVLTVVEAPGLEAPLRQGRQESDYRLISVPMNLETKASSNVLADLGPYDNTSWRLWSLKSNYFDFEGEAQYNELSGGASFEPGAAFFILSADGGTMRTGRAQSIPTVAPLTKTLHRGWNFIGNPFDFSVPVGALSLSNDQPPNVQTFSGGWSTAGALQPFQGYIIDAGSTDDNVMLTINPDLSAGKSAGKAGEVIAAAPSGIAWSIGIDAHSGEFFDTGNAAATGLEASTEWDALDRPEPPVIGDYISVYFPHREWGLVHKRFEVDARPEPAGGDAWDFEVATGARMPVTLTFHGLNDVPAHYDVRLVDRISGQIQDLRSNPAFTVITAGNGAGWPMQLLVGEAGYVSDRVESLGILPEKFELDQNYPNPFNPTTSIRYGVSEAATVSLTVYNLLGQVVNTLVNRERKEAGYHVAIWDARADDGSQAASGLYVYQLRVSPSGAGGAPSTISRKMLLVK